MQRWTVTLNHSILLYQLFSRVTRTLTIILIKIFKNDPLIEVSPGGEAPTWDPFTILLYSLFIKSPEKKWRRSVKMDIYKCPFFKSAGQMLQKASLKNTL